MQRSVLAALLLAALPVGRAAAQSRDFVCVYALDHADKSMFVGRQIVEVRTERNFNSGTLDEAFSAQFGPRVQGSYSRDDLAANGSGYRNIHLTQVVIAQALGEAKSGCLGKMRDFRNQGFRIYGVGSPIYQGSDDERVTEHYFLSALEYGDYQAGSVAYRARSGSKDDKPREPQRDARGYLPGEEAKIYLEQSAQAKRWMAEGDSLMSETQYAEAIETYRKVLFIGVAAYEPYHEYARQQIARAKQLQGAQQYADFNRSTGLALGFQWSQSYLEGDDPGIMGFAVGRRTFGLKAYYGVGTGYHVLGKAFGADSTDDGAPDEYTKYTLNAGAQIPVLHTENFGLHAGYVYMKTDQRALHLGSFGAHMAMGPAGMFRIDATPAFGKWAYGFSIILDFAD